MTSAPRRTAPPPLLPPVDPPPGPSLPGIIAVLVVGGLLLRAATVVFGLHPAWGALADWPDRLRAFAADPRAPFRGDWRADWGPRALPPLLSALWLLWGWLVVSVTLQLVVAAVEGVLGVLLPHARWPRALRGLVDGLTLTLTRRATTGAAVSLLGLTALRLGAGAVGAAPEEAAIAPFAAPVAIPAAVATDSPAADQVAPATRLAIAAAGYRFGGPTDGPATAHLAVVTPSADLAALAARDGLPWTAYRILHTDGGLTPVGDLVLDPAALPAGYLVIGPGPGGATTLPLIPTGDPVGPTDRDGADPEAVAAAQRLTDAPLAAMVRGAGLVAADPARATGHVFVVAPGDTLRGIAAAETGDAAAWIHYQVLHADGTLTPATQIAPTPDLIRPGDVFLGPGPGSAGTQSVPVALAGTPVPVAPVPSTAPAATVPATPAAVRGPTIAISVVAGQTATVALQSPDLGALTVRSVATPRHGTVTTAGAQIAYQSSGPGADDEQLVYIAESDSGQLVAGRLDIAITPAPVVPTPSVAQTVPGASPTPVGQAVDPTPIVPPTSAPTAAPGRAAPARGGTPGTTAVLPALAGVGALGLVATGTGLLARKRFRRNLAADAPDPAVGRTAPPQASDAIAVPPADEHAQRSLGRTTAVAIMVATAVDRLLEEWGLPAYTLLAAYERDHASLLLRAEDPTHRQELIARAPDLATALRCQVVAQDSGGEGDVELLLTRLQPARLAPGLDTPAPPFVPLFALPSGADVFGHYDLLGHIAVVGDQGEHVAQILAALLAELLALHQPRDLEPLLIGSPSALPVPELVGTAHWRTPPVDPADPTALLACLDAELRELHARRRRLEHRRGEVRPLQEPTRLLVIPELTRCFRDLPPAIARQVGNGLDQLAKLGTYTGQRLLVATTAPLESPAHFWQQIDLTLTLPLADPAASLRMVQDHGATELLHRGEGRLIPRLRPGLPRTWARIAPADFRGRVLTPAVQRELLRAIVRLHGRAPLPLAATPSGPAALGDTALPDHDARGQGLGVGQSGTADTRAAMTPTARDDADTAAARALAGRLADGTTRTPSAPPAPPAPAAEGATPVPGPDDEANDDTPTGAPQPLAAILAALAAREKAPGTIVPDLTDKASLAAPRTRCPARAAAPDPVYREGPAPLGAAQQAAAPIPAPAPASFGASEALSLAAASPTTPMEIRSTRVGVTSGPPTAITAIPATPVAVRPTPSPGISPLPGAEAPAPGTSVAPGTAAVASTAPAASDEASVGPGTIARVGAPPRSLPVVVGTTPAPPGRAGLAAILTPAAVASTSFLDAFGGAPRHAARPRLFRTYTEEADATAAGGAPGTAGTAGPDTGAGAAEDGAAGDHPLPGGVSPPDPAVAAPPADPPFAFHVLRPRFACTFRGRPLDDLTRYRRLGEVLLALAVCEPDSVRLALLGDLIWPDASPSAAATALNKQMSLWYQLAGRLLAEAGLPWDPKAILGYRAKGQVYSFDPAYVYCDLHEVYRRCTALAEILRRQRLADAELTAALGILAELERRWTGEFVAQGVPAWLDDPVRNFNPAASVCTQIAHLRGALAAALSAVGRHAEALSLYRRAYEETAETPHAERHLEGLLTCYVALRDTRRHRQLVREYRATQLARFADDELDPPTDDEIFSPRLRQLLAAHAAAFARERADAPAPR